MAVQRSAYTLILIAQKHFVGHFLQVQNMRISDYFRKFQSFLVNPRGPKLRRRGRATVQSETLESRVLLAAVVELVHDFENAPSSGILTLPVLMNGVSYFAAIDTLHGQELWKSDGTADGTVRMTDIVPGPGSTEISELTVVGDSLYFRATDRNHHGQLWKTDGTDAGTRQLRLGTSGDSIDAHSLTAWNDQLAFAATIDDAEFILATDGTDGGTRTLASVPGVDQIVSTSNGTLYFVDYVPSFSGNAHYSTIWKSDGSQQGTSVVVPFAGFGDDAAIMLISVGQQIYWIDEPSGFIQFPGYNELWTLDGMNEEPVRLSLFGGRLVPTGNKIFFHVPNGSPLLGSDIWVTQGTLESTKQLTSNRPPGPSILFEDDTTFPHFEPTPGTVFVNQPRAMASVGELLYFVDQSGIWKSNGTAAGTSLILASQPLADNPVPLFTDITPFANSLLLKSQNWPAPDDMWLFEISSGDLTRFPGVDCLSEIYGGGQAQAADGQIFFPASDLSHGLELWTSDGSIGGTRLVKDIAAGNMSSTFFPSGETPAGNLIVSSRSYPSVKKRILAADTGALLRSIDVDETTGNMLVLDDAVYLSRSARDAGYEFWKIDQSGKHIVKDVAPGRASGLAGGPIFEFDGSIWFIAAGKNSGLWKSDGTESGTILIAPLPEQFHSVESNDRGPIYFGAQNGLIYFGLPGGPGLSGLQLWRSDGTEQGTFAVSDFRTLQISRDAKATLVGNRLYLLDGGNIVASDGTMAGTNRIPESWLVDELYTAPSSGNKFQNSFVFRAAADVGQDGLWIIRNGSPNSELIHRTDSFIQHLAGIPGAILFLTQATGEGTRLWASDGTTAGTRPLSAFPALADDASIDNWSLVDNRVMFTYLVETTGLRQIWVTDGTETGTFPLRHDHESSLVVSEGGTFVEYKGGIAFTAATAEVGGEIFRINTTITVHPPTNISIFSGTEEVQLSWPDVTGAVQYDVWLQSLNNPIEPAVRVRTNVPQFQINGSSSGNTYRVWVRSLPVLGSPSAWSAATDFVLGPDPVMHSVTPFTANTKPTFSWAGPADVVSYEIWLNNRDTKTRTLFEKDLTATTFAVTQPLSPAKYAVWVRGTRADGTMTAWSTVNEFVVLAPPVTMTSGVGDFERSPRPTFEWSGVDGATGYDVRVFQPDGRTLVYSANNVTGLSHTPTQDLPAGKFLVNVRAVKNAQPISAWGNGNALWLKLPPTNLRSTATGFAWDASPFARSYTFELQGTNGALYVPRRTQSGTTIDFANPLPPGRYSLRVFTSYPKASSNWSETFSFEVFRPPVSLTSSGAATVDATPTVSWTAAPGASTYEVVVTKPGSTVPIYERTEITGTSHRIDVPLAIGISQIQVRAIFPDGSRSSLSPMQSLQIGVGTPVKFANNTLSWNAANQATGYELWINYLGTPNQRKIVYQPMYLTTSYTLPSTLPNGRYQTWLRPVRAESGQLYYGAWSTVIFDIV